MEDLRELYQTVILDHSKSPRNFGVLTPHNREASGHNPLCGDKLKVYAEVDEEGNLVDLGFEGSGCAISTASASLMTDAMRGKSRAEFDELYERFQEVVVGNPSETTEGEGLGKLAVFSGVREFPMRVKCATLAWHTLHAALEQSQETVKTE